MKSKNQNVKKEETLNSFAEKHEYEQEQKAISQWHTDESINDKNPKSRNNYKDNNVS